MSIKAVVFDMDDTLFAEKEYVLSGFAAVDEYLREQRAVGGFFAAACALFESDDKSLIFNRTLTQLGEAAEEQLIQTLIECYRNHVPQICLSDDAARVLKQLQGRVKLGLISDGYTCAQRRKVEALALEGFFDSIVLTDEWGRDCWKPSPFPYELTCGRLGVAPGECVYIADNPLKDFIAANRLGWTTVQVLRNGGIYGKHAATSEYQADYLIGNLDQLAEITELKHLFARKDEIYASI